MTRPLGLSTPEAQQRLSEFGPNRLVPPEPHRWSREAAKIMSDPMGLMLLATAAVYLLLDDTLDATILLIALVPVVGTDVFLELRAERALAALRSAFAPNAKLIRDGKETLVPAEQIVPGDVLLIEEGDILPADGTLLESSNLSVDESALTGESEPVQKALRGAEPDALLFLAGTTIVSGHGLGQVTETGQRTRYGHIAELVGATKRLPTPLQAQVSRMVRGVAVVGIATSAAAFAIELAGGYGWRLAFITSMSLAMAAVPEEFPLVLTLFLSTGAWRLARRKVLVRELTSVESLGSTSVICTDKTGTLTEGKFVLNQLAVAPGTLSEREVLEYAILACEPRPADAMEKAIFEYAAERGVYGPVFHEGWRLVADYPFDPAGKHMTHAWVAQASSLAAAHEPEARVASKGALEGIFEHSVVLPEDREWTQRQHEDLARQGHRILALAGAKRERVTGRREVDEAGLRLLALLAFTDPIRPGVRESIASCQRAGIEVKMLTGDHLLTAHAIADAIGLAHEPDEMINSADLMRLAGEARDRAIARCTIFARVSAEEKFMLANTLRAQGKIVAMTGDGINDAPALRSADIGISMGKRATAVARKTAAMVLLDDDFASIVNAVFEGRRIFANIRKAFLYLVAFHVPILLSAVLVPLAGLPLFLLPIHMVWLELIVHPVSAFLFEAEPADPEIMSRPPRQPSEGIFLLPNLLLSLATGCTLGIAVVGLYVWTMSQGGGEIEARTLALVSLILGSLMLIWLERAQTRPLWRTPLPRTSRFWIIFGAACLSLPAAMYLPPVQKALHLQGLDAGPWGLCAVIAAASVGWRLLPPLLRPRSGDRPPSPEPRDSAGRAPIRAR